jgi:ferredoxin
MQITRLPTATPATALHSTAAQLSAAERYSGAGEATVDMNRYNIPVDRAAEEWTCVLSAGSAIQEAGVYLECKDGQQYFVDTLKFDVRRSGGMGIELLELAGGREDGLGITMVSGLVEGGNADGSGIMAGDSLSQLEVVRSTQTPSATSVEEEFTSVRTEGLGYDATIDAILSLPEVASNDETVRITVKRIRRKPVVQVTLRYPPAQNEPDATIELFAGENLRRGMLVRGVKLNDKLSERFDSGGLGDCGADGTCATCVVAVSKGDELLSPKAIQEAQILKKNPRWRMACKTVVGHGMTEGDMTIQVNPRQWEKV